MAAGIETATVTVWVVVDAPGDYGVGRDEDACLQDYDDHIGGSQPRRVVRLTLTVPLPRPRSWRRPCRTTPPPPRP